MKPVNIPEGVVYAGINPLSGLAMFTTPHDWSERKEWEASLKTCHHLSIAGFRSWRLPSQDELQVLYDNRLDIGGFEQNSDALYWCAAPNYLRTVYWAQNFSSGLCVIRKPNHLLLFRPVCGN